jgi:putative salt-induced outer membrane protein YdiY
VYSRSILPICASPIRLLSFALFIASSIAMPSLAQHPTQEPVPGAKDQVVLKNGDRLTGAIVKSDDKEMIIKTEFAGTVVLQWEAVQSINSSQTLHVGLKDGRSLAGPVTTRDESIAVTSSAGPIETPKADVVSIRNDAEQRVHDKSLYPGITDNWTGGLDIGFGLTRGNSETKNFALGFNADRPTLDDKLTLYANSIYATNDAPGAVPNTTANLIGGGIRYDRNLGPRIFGFVGADFLSDELQTLDLRSVYGGGLGYHAIKRDSLSLDLLGGANYTREEYAAFTRDFPAGNFGEELTYQAWRSTEFTQKAYYFPDFNDIGEYRATLDFGLITKMNAWLGWQLSFKDIYVTNPPLGKKNNDVIFTTGLNLNFLGTKEEKCPCR